MAEQHDHYRVYRLSPGGRIVSGEWIAARDDADARDAAAAMCGAGTPAVELWHGARWIAVLTCDHMAGNLSR